MYLLAKIFISVVLLLSTCYVRPVAKPDETGVNNEKPSASKHADPEKTKSDAENPKEKTLKVVGVNDGDTITVFDQENKKQFKIRLATIDAPEYTQAFGKKSRRNLSDLVYKKEITVNSFGKDRYGRLIGEIFLDGKNINLAQIQSGYAWHYKRHQKQQTYAKRLIYAQAQKDAKENRLGVWQYDNPIPPWAYRKKNPRSDRKNRIETLRKFES